MVSGGPDSVALLRAIMELGSEPVVLHVDHGLRGEDSRVDAEFVRELCRELDVPFELRTLALEGSNLQERARRERYRFAGKILAERGLSSVATGHTADDVAETVLLNLSRGTGLRGLAGIPPVRAEIVRPLIERRRREIVCYLERLGQPYRTDPTNLTAKYARNRVRLEVLPVLEELYPEAGGSIARGASLLREDLEALEGLASGAVSRHGEEVVVSLKELRGMPRALSRYAVRLAYSMLDPGHPPLGLADVETILKLADKREGTRYAHMPENVTASVRFGEKIAFYPASEPFSGEVGLVSGTQGFERWVIVAEENDGFDARDAARPEVTYLDAEKGPYRVRMAAEGDTIRPLGLGGTKKVFRAMMDRKVPRDLRRRTPVVIDSRGRVAWIFMGEQDERFGVDKKTRRILKLEVERVP